MAIIGKNAILKFSNNDFVFTFMKRFQRTYLETKWLFWRQSINSIREPIATRILAIQTIVGNIF
jgi:hypothetical protein